MAGKSARHHPSGAAGGFRLSPMPSAELDDILDAAIRCFARFGVRRTSVQDIARELGLDRTTIYRRAGNADRIGRLLSVRELYRFLADVASIDIQRGGPEAVVDAVDTIVDRSRSHPVVAKMLADERDLVTSLAAPRAGRAFITSVAAVVTPLLAQGMRNGKLARRDPAVTAEWLVRVGLSLVLVEPSVDQRKMLTELLVPALTPPTAPKRTSRRKGTA